MSELEKAMDVDETSNPLKIVETPPVKESETKSENEISKITSTVASEPQKKEGVCSRRFKVTVPFKANVQDCINVVTE